MARLHLTGWSTKTLWQICSLLSLFPACISNPAISTFRLGRLCQSRTEVSSRLMNVLININYQQLPLSVFMSNGFLRHTPTNTHTHAHTHKAPESTDGSDGVTQECIMTSSLKSHTLHYSPPTHWGRMRTWRVFVLVAIHRSVWRGTAIEQDVNG